MSSGLYDGLLEQVLRLSHAVCIVCEFISQVVQQCNLNTNGPVINKLVKNPRLLCNVLLFI